MKVPHIESLIVYQLVQDTKLGCCKLSGQKVEHNRRIHFHVMANISQCIMKNLDMIECQCFHFRNWSPARIIRIGQLLVTLVNLQQRKISYRYDPSYLIIGDAMKALQP